MSDLASRAPDRERLAIDLAGAEHVDVLEPLFLALHAHHRACAPRAAAVAPFRDDAAARQRRSAHYRALLDEARAHLLVAREGARVVGYALVAAIGGQTSLTTGQRMAEIETLSVLPDRRGAGVGAALMDAVYERLRRDDIDELMLYVMDGNDGAARFYERRGMEPYLSVLLGRVPRHGTSHGDRASKPPSQATVRRVQRYPAARSSASVTIRVRGAALNARNPKYS